MKACLLFLFLATSSFCSLSQQIGKAGSQFDRRIEQLICEKKYQKILDKIEKESLVPAGTVTEKNIAKYRIGKPDKKNKSELIILYTIRYAIKEDKIVSVTEGDK